MTSSLSPFKIGNGCCAAQVTRIAIIAIALMSGMHAFDITIQFNSIQFYIRVPGLARPIG